MTDFENDINECLRVLQAGGLILYPTDTIWGIGCDATNAAAVERISALKNQPVGHAMIVLVADERDILQYCASPDLRVFDYLQNTTRPTTVLFEQAIGLADNLVGSNGSIGIRICKEPFCRSLLRRFRKPLVSTSAHISGRPPALDFHTIDPQLKVGVDYIVQYRQDDTSTALPSTVVKWNCDGTVTVLRN